MNPIIPETPKHYPIFVALAAHVNGTVDLQGFRTVLRSWLDSDDGDIVSILLGHVTPDYQRYPEYLDGLRLLPHAINDPSSKWEQEIRAKTLTSTPSGPPLGEVLRENHCAPATASAIPENSRFTVDPTAVLGSGGLGVVRRAADQHVLNRTVAWKELKSDRTDVTSQNNLLFEAYLTGILEHPGIVPVYSIQNDERGLPTFTMREVPGSTLRHRIEVAHAILNQKRRLQVIDDLLRDHFVPLCRIVQFAHAQGIVHRDLKPDNVIAGDFGETICLDWAGATFHEELVEPETHTDNVTQRHIQAIRALVRLTPPRSIVFSAHYAAPEMLPDGWTQLGFAGDAVPRSTASPDHRVDVFLLGATLSHVVFGKPPFSVPEGATNTRKQECLESPFAQELRPLVSICQKACDNVPRERFESVTALITELEGYLRNEPVRSYSYTLTEKAALKRRNPRAWISVLQPVLATLSALLLVASIWLGVTLIDSRENEKQAREQAKAASAAKAVAEGNCNRPRISEATGSVGMARNGFSPLTRWH